MKQLIKQDFLALGSGIVFGVGLGLSQMIDRQRVLGFLDLAGTWDPTLLFVLAGAVAFTVVAFRFVLRRKTPLLADKFYVPSRNDVDSRLVLGAALFGIGWGLSGYCPGPGITALVLGSWNPVLFVLALIAGMFAFSYYEARQ
ncbi:YeeE/YedE family protein [Synechococcus sp. PCC 7335]|uniref:DUF6691 family protein n=1 Tax=Synechococcus sp. (strain ATCC 29403 / PCC 7335) TaxID=91464 RepID=UPI00017ED9DE|nr:DUF6691 family protein [Synechococcus sp. PCC 7335]EDX83006.1 YeeE/YedE family protein [Synechococcus sp. PCC 7335]